MRLVLLLFYELEEGEKEDLIFALLDPLYLLFAHRASFYITLLLSISLRSIRHMDGSEKLF